MSKYATAIEQLRISQTLRKYSKSFKNSLPLFYFLYPELHSLNPPTGRILYFPGLLFLHRLTRQKQFLSSEPWHDLFRHNLRVHLRLVRNLRKTLTLFIIFN